MKMQAFYTQLSHVLEVYNPNVFRLAALTKVSREDAQDLKTEMSWSQWPETTA